MNRENTVPGPGRALAGFLLGVLLAIFSPFILLTEIFSLMPVIMVPAIGLVLLCRWSGRAPAMLSGMLLLLFTARMLGTTFMWMIFFMAILPAALLIAFESKPFFARMKLSIAAFCAGVVIAVAILYADYGGNMIERTLSSLPEAMRAVPAEMLSLPMQNLSATLGYELTVDEFHRVFEELIRNTIPAYQLSLPGLIFGGALVTAVACAGFDAWIRSKRGLSGPDDCVPLRDWALPASTTGGVLLMLLASYIIDAMGMEYGLALYDTVLNISIAVFSIQALGSMARYLQASPLKKGAQTAILVCLAVLSLMGASLYVALYGCASAIFGRHGALRQRMEEKMKDHHHSGEE